MTLHKLSRQVRLVARGEILAIEAKLAFAVRRALFAVLALLFAGLGLVLLNIGLFAYLTPLWGPVWTPAGLGFINLALAGVAFAISALMKPGPELALAEDIRNMAGEQLEAEIQSSSLGGGLEKAALSGLIVPALSAILGALAKRRQPDG
jgi:hypothetical protein